MEQYSFIVFLLLCIALLLFIFRNGRYAFIIKLLRFFIVLVALFFFSYWFIKRSTFPLISDSVTLEIANKLPQTVDFYIVEVSPKKDGKENNYLIKHSGKIRSNYYRIENIKLENSNEFWISGFLGKNDLVYFSQHAVENKKKEQKVEVNNYIIQSQKLSKIATARIAEKRLLDNNKSVYITLSLLLTFINLVLLIRRK